MRYLLFLLSATVTIALVTVLSIQLPSGSSKTPRLGFFLSPQTGFWQNAEPIATNFNETIKAPGIAASTEVYLDERLVPHIYAANDADAYYAQGFVHAKFRLWQMEFQTYIAAGRLSEITGQDKLTTDQFLRRMGLLYGAEHSLQAMEANADTKQMLDAYTAGVNAYIKTLKPKDIPFEYKLMDYTPEPWTNLKSALLLKLLSFDLSGGGEDDFLHTNTKNFFGINTYRALFPAVMDSLDPIVPKGTAYAAPSIKPVVPATYDSFYIGHTDSFHSMFPLTPDKDNGSNNWAVNGTKTQSGRPILCNDPHLGLNLPSLWYEAQITTPNYSAYGASLPGAPAIIIGFNDSISWGVTNAGRDVKDFYEVKFKDTTLKEYWFNGAWKQSTFRKEIIKIKGKPDVVETIAITVFGPVMYDHHYPISSQKGKYFALRWKAHDASNEVYTFHQLNRAKGYSDYLKAISYFHCPGQNFVFASKTGEIAVKQEGEFVAKWKTQGEFVMPGTDSSYMWQGWIPSSENALQANPARGFVSSANQMVADTNYPYYLGEAGNFALYRGITINKKLTAMHNITVNNMQQMQNNNDNDFAAMALPVLMRYMKEATLNATEKKYLDMVAHWNLTNNAGENGAVIFQAWWDSTARQVYDDEYALSHLPLVKPLESTLLEALLRDSAYAFADDITTKNKKETMYDVVPLAFKKAVVMLAKLDKEGKLTWGKYKDTKVSHYTKIDALSKLHILNGGSRYNINATKPTHGPSWRMIVEMTDTAHAYGVYPGGQSGNPGSAFYDNFIATWAAGKYYSLQFLTKAQSAAKQSHFKGHMVFTK